MKRLVSACTAALLIAAPTAQAQDSGPRSYTGGFTCDNASYSTEWVISPSANAINVRVYYQRNGSSNVNWLDLVEQRSGGKPGLYDANGNMHLALEGNSERMQASWSERASPSQNCASFIVEKVASSTERFDEIFALMETPAPDEATAQALGKLTRFKPIVFALPELDQQTYGRRYQELERSFWENYRQTLTTELSTLPVQTADDQTAFVSRLNSALDGGLSLDPTDTAQRTAYDILVQASDRLAASGISVEAALYPGSADTCTRFQGITARQNYYDFKHLELAARLPTDYWSRSIADELLTSLRSCPGVNDSYPRELADSWSKFQQNQELVSQMLAEQSRLLALPISLETLVATRYLQPDQAVVQSLGYGSNYIERFFGAALQPRRAELVTASLSEIAADAERFDAKGSESQNGANLADRCEALQNFSAIPSEAREQISEACAPAVALVQEKQITMAVASIRETFAAAEPESQAAADAIRMCDSMSSNMRSDIPYEVVSQLYAACSEESSKLKAVETSLRCERAVAASGASPSLLESKVVLSQNRVADVRQLVCSTYSQGGQLTFASSGFLMWSGQTMQLDMGPERPPMVFAMTTNDTGAWVLAANDASTTAQMTEVGLEEGSIGACLMDRMACR